MSLSEASALFFCNNFRNFCNQSFLTLTVVMKYIFKRIALKEPQFKPLSPHTFRHTFATRCIERGMNPKTLQIILGHSTIQITMNLYCHVTDDMLISEMSKFEAGANNDNQPIGVKVV